MVPQIGANVYDIIKHDYLILTENGLEALGKRLTGKGADNTDVKSDKPTLEAAPKKAAPKKVAAPKVAKITEEKPAPKKKKEATTKKGLKNA